MTDLDFSDINETNAPRTLGELRELTENKPISQEQFKNILSLSAKRDELEKANPPKPMAAGEANPNLGNLEEEVGAQPVPCINCGTDVPRAVHKEEMGFCPECQEKWFNHELDDEDGYKCGVCGKTFETDEENMNHRCFE